MEPYVPQALPPPNLDLARIIRKVGPANAALARYDGLLQSVINPSVMLSPLTNREAVLSSKIEGTQATVDEVLEYEAGIGFEGEKAQDIQEIVNYRKTLVLASEALAEQPLYAVAPPADARGADGQRSRTRQNARRFPHRSELDRRARNAHRQATFVPPSPLQLLDHLQAWEAYLSTDDFDVLVQTAVVHAQFELLHPFKDGNGRIGRLLIPLFLFQKRALASPMFYMSEYLEARRDALLRPPPGHQPGRRLERLDRVLPRRRRGTGPRQHRQGTGDQRPLRAHEGRRSPNLRGRRTPWRCWTRFSTARSFSPSDFVERSGIPKADRFTFAPQAP